ncbi:UNVERIFIED_CONTAM: hypothetical protein FKN15_074788 [Acipenser sinensis]
MEQYIETAATVLIDGALEYKRERTTHSAKKPSSRCSSSSSASPSPPPRKRKKSHWSMRSADTEQMERLWAAVSHYGTVLLELLCEHSANLREQIGSRMMRYPSPPLRSWRSCLRMWSDSTSPAVRLSLSAELMALIKRATAVLQVPWCTECEARQSIFDDEPATSPTSPPVHPDFLFEIQSSWGHPATAPAVSQSMDTLYMVHDAEKLDLAQFPPVKASIAVLVQAPNLALLSKASICPNKQCRVSEMILKRAYLASAFTAWLGNFNSILVDYQSHLLLLSDNHRPSPLQLDELCLVLA